jgi:hypothetical protein
LKIGAKVVLSDGNPALLQAASASLSAAEGQWRNEICSVVVDVRKEEDMKSLLARCLVAYARF